MLEASTLKQLEDSSDYIALLDKQANVIYVNEAWKRVGETTEFWGSRLKNVNYLQVCHRAIDYGAPGAEAIYRAISDALDGLNSERPMKFGRHAPDKLKWFTCDISLVHQYGDPAKVMVRWFKATDRQLLDADSRSYGSCSTCGIELPLLVPEPDESASSWECAFCGNRYRGVADDRDFERFGSNVRRLDV